LKAQEPELSNLEKIAESQERHQDSGNAVSFEVPETFGNCVRAKKGRRVQVFPAQKSTGTRSTRLIATKPQKNSSESKI
jgi:hypothetical protein